MKKIKKKLKVKGIHCAHMGVLFLMETASFVCAIRGRARDLLRVWALWTQDNRGLMAAIVPRAHALRNSSKVVGGCVRFGSAHPLSPNGRMCALTSPLPPFPTNPLSQHRNSLCAHGVLFLMETASFICAIRGRARDLLRSGHSGPKTIAASWPQSFPGPCAVCISPFSQWTQRSFGCHVFHWCVSCTSWCLQSHDPGLMTHLVASLCVPGRPEASWPRSAFPASRMSEVSHRLMTASRTSVIPGSFPGGDAGPRGPAPLSPRELLKWTRAK